MKRPATAIAALVLGMGSAAMAQQATPFATGVPIVGVSAGPYCTGVSVGGVLLAVPNSDSNAVAILIALSAAEARGQTVTAYIEQSTNCSGLAAQQPTGTVLPHLASFK